MRSFLKILNGAYFLLFIFALCLIWAATIHRNNNKVGTPDTDNIITFSKLLNY